MQGCKKREMGTSTESQLNQLFESRYHGAVNIAGIKFQLTYSVLRAFDLYKPDAPDSIQLEGIEDLDIRGRRHVSLIGLKAANQYIQVKTSKRAWDWSRFADSKIVENFVPVWSVDPMAELLVVTNFGYKGKLDELAKFCSGQRSTLSDRVKRDVLKLCRRVGHANVDPMQLINRISFTRISEEELSRQVTSAIVEDFDLTTPNSDIYFLALMAKFLDLAAQREEVQLHDLESIRLFVQEQIDLGATNPAVQNGWLERLTFVEEEHPEDYYEGKNARPGHILAGLDVRRPVWESRIHEALQRSRVCIVRASSGQGKSTLLYRYAYQNYHPETTFIVKRLSDESMVGPIKQAIVTRQRLGLPILVFIDNVGTGLRFWHRLAAEFAGQEVYFLVTVREEDWHRYSGSTSGFLWEIVTPTLSLEEARNIYAEFERQGKIAAGVQSAEWAFEQVADRQLLIEFVYLITHGQMLADRLRDQVQEMQRLGEDQAKLEVLQLVSVAQAYGAKVTIQALLNRVRFEQDPDSTLGSLEREYLLFADGACEGLHLVRSQHLVPLLHRVVPVEHTMVVLSQILDLDNLESFIGGTFIDSQVSHASLLEALIERCRHESLDVINRIAMALFAASETMHYRLHQSLFDTAFDQIGDSGIFMLCLATLPFQTVNPIEDLKRIFGADHPNLNTVSDLAAQFTPRQWDKRYEARFLQSIVDKVTPDLLTSNISQIGALLGWYRLAGLDPSHLVRFLASRDWREQIYEADLVSAANLLAALYNHARESYDRLLASDRASLMSYFKLASDTLTVKEQNGDIYIEFVVDGEAGHASPHDQTLERLRLLWRYFPDYQRYCSQGLYLAIYGLQPPVDDTKKAIPNDTLKLEIDAERNAAYLRTAESHYAAQSVYEWQEQWFGLRTELLVFLERAIDLYISLSRGVLSDVDALNSALRGSLLRELHLKDLPVSLAEPFKEEKKAVDEWIRGVSLFLRQFGEHDPINSTQESSWLMRYNLRDAIKKMPSAHQAFQRVVAETQPYFELSSLDDREIEEYSYLADVLDFWFERPPGRVDDLRRAVAERRHSKRKQFAEAVRSTVASLEEQGFTFVYPTGPLLDHPLTGLCLAFEVSDFGRVIEQLLVIIVQLASFPFECQFIYLVPLLNGHRYLPMVWRIGFDHACEIAQGALDGKNWALLPVESPEALFKVLPEIPQTSLDELDMSSEFYRIYGALNTVRNTIHLVQGRLSADSPFEAQLGERYRRRLQNEVDRLSADIRTLSEQMLQFAENNSAAKEWLEFCRCCAQRLENLSNFELVDPEAFVPINVWQDVELQTLFGRYLNARYLETRST